jgi:hypothetical protein
MFVTTTVRSSVFSLSMEVLFEIIGELLLQLVFEALAELGLRCFAEPFNAKPNPFFAAMGYTLFGAIMGGISLWPFSSHLVASGGLRILNLIITPITVGFAMAALGAWRTRRGQTVLRIDRFAYGCLFALSLALVRFAFAK